MQMQQPNHQRSVLVTGCTDKTLRIYDFDTPELADAYQRMDYNKRKDQSLNTADVLPPSMKLTGQH